MFVNPDKEDVRKAPTRAFLQGESQFSLSLKLRHYNNIYLAADIQPAHTYHQYSNKLTNSHKNIICSQCRHLINYHHLALVAQIEAENIW